MREGNYCWAKKIVDVNKREVSPQPISDRIYQQNIQVIFTHGKMNEFCKCTTKVLNLLYILASILFTGKYTILISCKK